MIAPNLKTNKISDLYICLAGLCWIFIGIGIARLAYSPMIPLLIEQGWFNRVETSYLGTSNFIGYFVGILIVNKFGKIIGQIFLLKNSLMICVLVLCLSAIHVNFFWLFCLRFIAGLAGAFIFILTPSLILRKLEKIHKGFFFGLIFTGSGLGVIAFGVFLSLFQHVTVSFAWLVSGLISFIALLISFPVFKLFRESDFITVESAQNDPVTFINDSSINKNIDEKTKIKTNCKQSIKTDKKILLLSVLYFLFGVGAVPNLLYLTDYIHENLHISLGASAYIWFLFGAGSIVGPIITGFLSDKMGLLRTLRLEFFIAAFFVSILSFSHVYFFYVVSSIIIGALLPSIVLLFSKKILDLCDPVLHTVYWARLTLIYSVAQEFSSYFMSFLLKVGFAYKSCFLISVCSFALGGVLLFLFNLLLADYYVKNPNNQTVH